jgi:hypothetical protein
MNAPVTGSDLSGRMKFGFADDAQIIHGSSKGIHSHGPASESTRISDSPPTSRRRVDATSRCLGLALLPLGAEFGDRSYATNESLRRVRRLTVTVDWKAVGVRS